MKSSWVNTHLQVAKEYAKKSKAERLQVGALIVRDDRPVVVGINGMVSGGSNVCETLEQDGYNMTLVTKPEVIHAEKNAIAFAAAEGTATKGASMVLTHSPCIECATLIKQAKIKEVYYGEEFRDLAGVEFLRKYIKCSKIGV